MFSDRFGAMFLSGAVLLSLGLVACGQDSSPASTPVPPQATATPSGPALATPVPVQPTASPTPTPTSTPEPAPAATPAPLTLELFSPVDGASSEIGAIRVQGNTGPGVEVVINGTLVEAASDGSFQHDIVLEYVETEIEVAVEGLPDEAELQPVVVLFEPPATGLPFNVFYPPDGLEVDQPNLAVIGGTRTDAAVGVNGSPVEVNVLGLFSTTVPLEPGANLIEVVAADVQGDVRFEAVAVFYLP